MPQKTSSVDNPPARVGAPTKKLKPTPPHEEQSRQPVGSGEHTSFTVFDELKRFDADMKNKVTASRKCARIRTLASDAHREAGVSTFCITVLPSVKQSATAPRRARVTVCRTGGFATPTLFLYDPPAGTPAPASESQQMAQHLLTTLDLPRVFAALGMERPQRGWNTTDTNELRIDDDLCNEVLVKRTLSSMTEEQVNALNYRRNTTGAAKIGLLTQTVALQRTRHAREIRDKDRRIAELKAEREELRKQVQAISADLTGKRNREFFSRSPQEIEDERARMSAIKKDFVRAGTDAITLHAFFLLRTLRKMFGGKIIPTRIYRVHRRHKSDACLGEYNVEWNRMLRDMFQWCRRQTPAISFALFNMPLPFFASTLAQIVHVATGLSPKVRSVRLRHRVNLPKIVEQVVDYFSWLHASREMRNDEEDMYPLLMGTIDWPRFQTAVNECSRYVHEVDETTIERLNVRRKHLWAANKRKHSQRKRGNAKKTSGDTNNNNNNGNGVERKNAGDTDEGDTTLSDEQDAVVAGSVDGTSSSRDDTEDSLDLGEEEEEVPSTPAVATSTPPSRKQSATHSPPDTSSQSSEESERLSQESEQLSVSSEASTGSSSSSSPSSPFASAPPRARRPSLQLPSPPPVLMRFKRTEKRK